MCFYYDPYNNLYRHIPMVKIPWHEINGIIDDTITSGGYRINLPEAPLFKEIYSYASENGFAGGFPTFNRRGPEYEVVLINSGFGVKQDAIDLDPNPADFPVHMRNVDRYLRDDSRYLSGFPNFHQSGRLFGAIRLFKNAGERRWVPTTNLGFVEADSNEDRMRKAQHYAVNQGFVGGFPSFEHRGQDSYEIILLNPNAATIRYIMRLDEAVKLTKTITSFHYPHPPTQMRKFRVYLEVTVPKSIADTMQEALDRCMEEAKKEAAIEFAPCIIPPNVGCAISKVPQALTTAIRKFTTCMASVPEIYPYINRIKVDIKTDRNA